MALFVLDTDILVLLQEGHAKLKLGVKHTDLRIAAITLEHGGTLVTRNTVDFRDVPGLVIENWAAP